MICKNNLKNQKGFAILEAIPVLLIVFTVGGAALGSWGLVHTAILNSIAARHNAFFILNHRSDLTYRRDFGNNEYGSLSRQTEDAVFFYGKNQTRFFFIKSEKQSPGGGDKTATTRFVNFLEPGSSNYRDREGFLDGAGHNDLGVGSKLIWRTKATHRVDPAWIMVGYGICLTQACGS